MGVTGACASGVGGISTRLCWAIRYSLGWGQRLGLGGEHDSCKIPDSLYDCAELVQAYCFLPVDLCSSFGTPLQGNRRILTLPRDGC